MDDFHYGTGTGTETTSQRLVGSSIPFCAAFSLEEHGTCVTRCLEFHNQKVFHYRVYCFARTSERHWVETNSFLWRSQDAMLDWIWKAFVCRAMSSTKFWVYGWLTLIIISWLNRKTNHPPACVLAMERLKVARAAAPTFNSSRYGTGVIIYQQFRFLAPPLE